MTTLDGTTTATTPTQGTAAAPRATDETTTTPPPPPGTPTPATPPAASNGDGTPGTAAGTSTNGITAATSATATTPAISNGTDGNGTPGTAAGTSTNGITAASSATATTPGVGNGASGNGAMDDDTNGIAAATSDTATATRPAATNGANGTMGNGANGMATAAGDDAATTAPGVGNGAGGNGAKGAGVGDGNGIDGVGGVRKGRRTQRERSAASANRLLDAAIELIATQGFAATTQADIGTRAGYSRAMVRERFGSAESLLDALFQRLVDDWHLQAAPHMAGLTGPEVLALGLELFRDRLRERPLEARCLFVLQFEAAGPTRSLRERVAAVNRALTEGVACALRDGQAEGTVRDDVDPDTTAIDWVAHFRGANFLWLVDPTYDLDGFCARWAAQQFVLFGPSVTSVR